MGNPIIILDKLSKSYGKHRGIEKISFAVERGEIFGFIGPNGAGKSTTIRTLMGLLKPTSGTASVFGLDCGRQASEIAKDVGYLPSENCYYNSLKVKEMLLYTAELYGVAGHNRMEALAERLNLDLSRRIGDLSLGNKKKVGIVSALLPSPKLLIMDEPTSGLDPLIQQTFYDLLKEENERGTTIFLSSHVLSEVQRLCELKQSRKYILIWAVSLAICIFSMTPVYYGMVETAGTLPTGFAQGGFFETVGVSLELLTMPLGMYSFLTGFFMIAGGIFGMHLGLSLHTKECTENTAEFLYTKPCGRQMIYKGKLLCVLAGVCVTGISYLLASFFAMMLFHPGFPAREFWLVAGSFVLITLFFALLGTMAGIFRPNHRSPLLKAGLVVFVEYCITSFSRTFFENSFRKNMQYVTEKIPRGGLLV